MEEVKVKIGIDDQGFATGLKRDIGQMEQLSATAKKSGMSIDDMGRHVKQLGRDIDEAADKGTAGFGRLEKAAIAFFSIQKAKEFVGKVYEVRSEIEKLETSFRVLVGNKDKADALFASIRKFAVETPMQLKDLAGAAQTMMGFGIATEDVMENLKALGNVAMGDSQKFQSLALAFSQMSATGKLMGQDFLQMVNAGFNLLDQMAKTTGKSVAVLKKEMSEGAISADMVRQAFIDATGEGGKFNGMLEAKSKTMAGAYSNLQGAIDDMLNEIGQKSEGIMSGAIDVATTLAQNYETVGKVLAGLIGTYGVYKAAVMTVTAIESFRTKNLALQAVGISGVSAAEAIHYGWLVLVQKAQALLNATMLANPYVAVAAAIAAVTAALLAFGSEQDRINAAYDEYIRKKDDAIKKEEEHKRKINELIQIAGDEQLSTDSRRKAMVRLMGEYPELFKKYNTEIEALKDIYKWKAAIAELEGKKSLTNPENELTDIEIRIAELEKKGKWSLASTNSYAGTHTSSRSRTEEEELQALYKRRNEITKTIEKDRGESYLANLTGVSNADLERQINERRNLLAQMATDGKRYGRVKTGGATGVFDQSQLEGQLKKLEWEQNRRKQLLADQSKDFVHEATKAYNAEKVILQQLESLHDPKKRSASNLEIDGKKVSDMGSGEFLAAIEKQQKAVDEAKKKVDAYNKARNGGSSSTSKENAVAKEDASRRQRIFEQELSERQRQAKQREDMEDAIANAAIANEQSRAKRELMQMEKDHDDALAAIDRQAEEMRKANYEAEKKAWEAANTDKTKSWADTDTAKDVAANGFANIKLTEEQMATLKALRDKENADYARSVKERFDAERQSMLDYLQEYGTYQQQRLAIAEEYSKKIAEAEAAGNKWEVKRLTAERDSRIAQANAQSLAMNIDWNQTFQGVGNVLQDIAKETLQKVNDYMGTAEFKGLDAASKKAYTDLQKQLIDAGGQKASNPFSSKTWDEIAKLTDDYKFHVKALADASETHTNAVADYQKAVENEKAARADLDKAIRDQAAHLGKTDQGEYDDAVNTARQNLANATQGVADTFQQMQESGEAVQQQQTNVSNTQQGLHQKTEAAAQGLNNFNTVLGQLTSGTLKGFVDGVSNVIAALTKDTEDDMQGLIGVIGKKAGGIIGAILSIIDMLGDKPVEFFDNLFDGISKVIEAVISHIPEIIESVVKGVGSIIGSVFSGIGGLFGIGAVDNSAYEAALDKWGGILDAWEDNVKYERELMEKAYGVKAIDYSKQALKALEDAQKAASEIYKGWASSGAGWFSHSHGYETNRDTNWEYLWQYDEDLAKQIGVEGRYTLHGLVHDGGNVAKLFDLTWEQLEKLQNRAPQFWASMSDEARNYLNQYIEAGKTAQETIDALNEQLTTTTKENIFDDFLSSLYELADGSEDVMDDIASNWKKMVNRMVINNTIGAEFQKDVEDWYKRLASLQEEYTNGCLKDADYKTALDGIYAEYTDLVAKAQMKMEDFTKRGILQPIETASEKAFTQMRDNFLSALTDMNTGTQDFMDDFINTMVNELVDKFVLDDEFTKWMADWKTKYTSIIGDESLPEEKRIRQLKALMQELAEKQDELNEKARTWTEAFKMQEDVFSDLADNFKEAILDMEQTVDDFTGSLKSSFRRAITNSFIMTPEVRNQIEEWVKTANELTNPNYKGKSGEDTKKKYLEWKEFFEGFGIFEEDMEKGYEHFSDFLESLGWQPEEMRQMWDEYVAVVEAMRNQEYSDEDRAADIEAHANALKALYESVEASQEYWDKILGFGDNGGDTSPFDNLRDTFLDTLTDIEGDAEKFRESLIKTLTKDLIEKLVLDVPITLNVTRKGEDGTLEELKDQVFDNFNAYSDDWNIAYLDGMKELQEAQKALNEARASGDEEAIAAAEAHYNAASAYIDTLIDELVALEVMTAEEAKKFTERMKKAAQDTTFTDMVDSLVSSLMDVEGDVEDIANDMKKTIVQKLVEAFMVSDAIKPLLDELQATFNAVMGMEGLTPEQRAQMMKAGFTGTDEEGNEKVFLGIDDEGVTQRLADAQSAIKALMEAIGFEFDKKEGFSDLRGAFISALTDMEGDASTFGKNIGKAMAEQMLDSYIDKTYKEQIAALNEEWAAALESGDPAKIEAIRKKVLALYASIGDDEAVKQLATDIKELQHELDTTFSDMGDDWVSALMDMDSTAEAWGRQIGRSLTQKLVKELVVDKQLQQYLDAIQTAYNDAIGKEGATIESVLAAVIPKIDAAVAATEQWKPVVEEIAKRFQELDNSTPLDNIRSSFLSQLMDMKSDTKDFARSINEILTEAFIDKFVLGEEFDKRLEEWQQQYASIMGGNYSEEERAKLLKQLRQAIVTAKEGYAAEAQAIHDLMGTANYADQTATMNMSDKATYEQMDQYLGVQMGIYMVTEQILTTLRGGTTIDIPAVTLSSFSMATETTAKQILSAIQTMKAATNPDSSTIQEMRNMIATGNEYLLDIKRSNREILTQFGAKLDSINGKLAKL